MPLELERDVSIKRDCSSEAEMPRLREIFSKLPLETLEVSIISRSEFWSGTEEFGAGEIGDESADKVKKLTSVALASVIGFPIFSVGSIEESLKASKLSRKPELKF